jgi:hypothetical protein
MPASDLYPYDSDDEKENLSFSRSKIGVTVQEVVKASSIPPVSSYILTETGQSLLDNPESTRLYTAKKTALHTKLGLTDPGLASHSFYKFVPSLAVYDRTKSTKYKYSIFKKFYDRFKEEVDAFGGC